MRKKAKLSSTIKPAFYKNMKYWLKLSDQKDQKGYFITNCDKTLPLPPQIDNIYWRNL